MPLYPTHSSLKTFSGEKVKESGLLTPNFRFPFRNVSQVVSCTYPCVLLLELRMLTGGDSW